MEKSEYAKHVNFLSHQIKWLVEEYCKANDILDEYKFYRTAYEVYFFVISSSLQSAILSGADKKTVIEFASQTFKEIIDYLETVNKVSGENNGQK